MVFLLVAAATDSARADCPAAPLADADDMVVSFLALNGTQAAPGSLMPSTVKEGMLVYDDTANNLKICDGTNWVGVGSGGSDTLASLSCSSGQIAKYNGAAWACAADGGGVAGSVQTATQSTSSIVLADGVLTDTATLTVATSGTYSIMARGYNVAVMPWIYFSSSCYLYVNGVQVQSSPFYYGAHDASTGSSAFFPHSLHHVASLTAGQTVKTSCLSTSNSATRHAYEWRIDLVPVGGGGADTLAGLSCSSGQIPKWNGTAWACAADGGGNSSAMPSFHVHRDGTAQTVTAGSVTQFDATTATFDTESDFDLSTNRFTPSVAGKYILTGAATAASAASGTFVGVYIRKNGNAIGHNIFTDTNGSSNPASRAVTVIAEANGTTDYFEMYIYRGVGTSFQGSGADTYFAGSLVSGGSGADTLSDLSCSSGEIPKWNGTAWACAADGGGSGVNAPAFFAHKTAVQTVTSGSETQITFNTETYDTTNNFVLSTDAGFCDAGNTYKSCFKPNVAGKYLVIASVNVNEPNNRRAVYIRKNGTIPITNGLDYAPSVDVTTANTVAIVGMNGTTDFLTATVYTDGTGTTVDSSSARTYFNAMLMGGGSGSDTLAALSCSANQIPKWNGTAWACAADGGGSGSGTPNYLLKTISATMTGVTAGTVVNFNTVSASTGSKITQSGNRITVAPGSYMLTASVRSTNITNEAADYGIYDVTNNTYVGTLGSVSEGANTDVASHAFVSSAVSTTYEVRVVGVAGVVDFLANNYSSFSAVELGGGAGADTLSGLSCSANQIPKWTGSAWACAADSSSSTPMPHLRLFYNAGTLNRSNVIPFSASESTGGATWASNKFTVVTPGVYLMTVNGYAFGQHNLAFTIRKNTSDLSSAFGDASLAAKYGGASASAISYLNAGDQIDFFYNHDTPNIYLTAAYASVAYLGGSSGAVAGSDKQVQFNDNSAQAGAAQLYWDKANNRLGVGTTTPLTTLDVVGVPLAQRTFAAYYARDIDAATIDDIGGNFAFQDMAGNIGQALAVAGGNLRIVQPSTTKLIEFWTNGNPRMVVTPDGRVGIGVYGPNASALLDLSSTTSGFLPPRMTTAQVNAIASPADGLMAYDTDTDTIKLRANGAWVSLADGTAGASSGTTGYVQISGGSGFTHDSTAGGQFFWDSTNHRLGLGTATPSQRLDTVTLGGSNYVTSRAEGYSGFMAYAHATSGAPLIGFVKSRGAIGSYAPVQSGDWIGYLSFAGYDTVSTSETTAIIRAHASGTVSEDVLPTSLVFETSATNAAARAERMRISANGDIGIGTANPTYKLDISGAGNTGLRVTSGTGASASLHLNSDYYNSIESDTVDLDFNLPATRKYKFRNAGVVNVVIDGNGNVGIGTTTPSAILHTKTSGELLRLESSAARGSGNAFLQFNDPTGIKGFYGYTGSDDSLRMWNSLNAALVFAANGGERMRLNPDGNVGIGTAIPGAKLHVADSANALLRLESGNGLASGILHFNGAAAGSGLGLFPAADTRAFMLYNSTVSNSTPIMTGLQNGNVGIGTTSPGTKLDVNGSAKVTQLLANGAAGIAIIHATAGTGTTTLQGTNTGTSYGVFCNASNCGGTSAWVNTSDVRLKKRIEPLANEEGLETVLRLRPVAFHWKDENRDAIEGRKLGLIAQEVEPIVPEVVHTADDPTKTKSIAYSDLVPVLIRAIQDLKADNDNLRVQLKAANDNQAMEIEELGQEIEALKAAR